MTINFNTRDLYVNIIVVLLHLPPFVILLIAKLLFP
jgi:hypothetical protein